MIKLKLDQTLFRLSGPAFQTATFCRFLELQKGKLVVAEYKKDRIATCSYLLKDHEFFTVEGFNIKTGELACHSGVTAALRKYQRMHVTSLHGIRMKLLEAGFTHLPKNAEPVWPWACGNTRDTLESIQDAIKKHKHGHFEIVDYTIISLADILDKELDWLFSPTGLGVMDFPAELCEKAWDTCQNEYWITPKNKFRQSDLGKLVLFIKG